MSIKGVDLGLEFENWICFTLPWQLNLSPSKEVGVKMKFGGFANLIRPLVNKAPEEFELFFSGLTKRLEEISKWRVSKGYAASPEIYKGEWLTYPNGRLRHQLVQVKKEK